jgi:hypothetical protein
VELPSANERAVAGNRGGFCVVGHTLWR